MRCHESSARQRKAWSQDWIFLRKDCIDIEPVTQVSRIRIEPIVGQWTQMRMTHQDSAQRGRQGTCILTSQPHRGSVELKKLISHCSSRIKWGRWTRLRLPVLWRLQKRQSGQISLLKDKLRSTALMTQMRSTYLPVFKTWAWSAKKISSARSRVRSSRSYLGLKLCLKIAIGIWISSIQVESMWTSASAQEDIRHQEMIRLRSKESGLWTTLFLITVEEGARKNLQELKGCPIQGLAQRLTVNKPRMNSRLISKEEISIIERLWRPIIVTKLLWLIWIDSWQIFASEKYVLRVSIGALRTLKRFKVVLKRATRDVSYPECARDSNRRWIKMLKRLALCVDKWCPLRMTGSAKWASAVVILALQIEIVINLDYSTENNLLFNASN